jgi:hypothetical protein
MANSPLAASAPLPGPAVLGHLAGATIVRAAAFLSVHGYEPHLFVGGEETLLSLDLAARGWWLCYVDELVVHHHPSPNGRASDRLRVQVRNALWTTWLRLPVRVAVAQTWRVVRRALGSPTARRGVADAVVGASWIVRRRAVVPPFLAEWVALLDFGTVDVGAPRSPRSTGAGRRTGSTSAGDEVPVG